MEQRSEYGIILKTPHPIDGLSDDELDELDSDCYLLEGEYEALRRLIDAEMQRRGR